MTNSVPTRVHYFERQFLRAEDFAAEQAYHLKAYRRHNLAGHHWGILHGLEVMQDEDGNLNVQAGLAVDGYGRTLILPAYRAISHQAFVEQASDILDVWLVYERRPVRARPRGNLSCDDNREWHREIETARVEVLAPDRNQVAVGGSGQPDGRKPLDVPVADWDFGPTQAPPDEPDRRWPVYLGRIERVDNEFQINLGGRPYAGLVGEFLRSPSGRALVQVGAEKPHDPNRFAVYLASDDGACSPASLSTREPEFAIEASGDVRIYNDTTLYGNLLIDGGAAIFEGDAAPESAQPWQIYHSIAASKTDDGVTEEQLRVEMASFGPSEVVIGYYQQQAFVPCLTIRNDCTVTVHGNLEAQGGMDVAGGIQAVSFAAQVIEYARKHFQQESGSSRAEFTCNFVKAFVPRDYRPALAFLADQLLQVPVTARVCVEALVDAMRQERGRIQRQLVPMFVDILADTKYRELRKHLAQELCDKLDIGLLASFSHESVSSVSAAPPQVAEDDFTRIHFIGPRLAERLKAEGIQTFEEFGDQDPVRIGKLIRTSTERAKGMIREALKLAAEKRRAEAAPSPDDDATTEDEARPSGDEAEG
jgi:hypothetical protein